MRPPAVVDPSSFIHEATCCNIASFPRISDPSAFFHVHQSPILFAADCINLDPSMAISGGLSVLMDVTHALIAPNDEISVNPRNSMTREFSNASICAMDSPHVMKACLDDKHDPMSYWNRLAESSPIMVFHHASVMTQLRSTALKMADLLSMISLSV